MKQRIVRACANCITDKNDLRIEWFVQVLPALNFSIHRTIWSTVKHNRATADYRSYRVLLMLQGASSEM